MELDRPCVDMSSWDGTLSSDDFYVAACAFTELWKKYNVALPQWSWVHSIKKPWTAASKVEGYLSLENVVLPKSAEEDDHESRYTEEDECSCSNGDEFIDDAVLVETYGRERRRYDFHIVYSTSYKVPVLYLRAYYSDGQSLALDDIEKDVSANTGEVQKGPKWTFMTVEEHPYLNRPWCTLHPCGTSEWMKLLFSTEASVPRAQVAVEKYLVSWFTVVGQMFGLKIPFKMLGNATITYG